MRRLLLVVSTAILGITLTSASGQTTVLGILEDNPGRYEGEPHFSTVRVVFEKRGNNWVRFGRECHDRTCLKSSTRVYPKRSTWNAGFDGHGFGKISAITPDDFEYYSSVGQQRIISDRVPTVGERSTQFGGFTEAAVFRPLIANSRPSFRDPDGWRPASPSPKMISGLRDAFRKRFPKLCRTSSAGDKLEPYPYANSEVRILKAYASKMGWTLARLHIEAVDCQDTEAGFDIDDPWFAVGPDHAAAFLGAGMWFVDAGDYDGDGASELVFSIDRYNRGGYQLFYKHFKKRAVFEFSYH